MIINISEKDITRLVSPCKNRNADLVKNSDGSVSINNNTFGTMRECEDYLIDIGRVDIGRVDSVVR